MINVLLLAAIASLLFLKPTKSKKSYKYLIKDLMEHHGVNQSSWNKNLRINKDGDGLLIGSNDGFVQLTDKSIKLQLGKLSNDFGTVDVEEVIKKMKGMIDSKKYSESDEKIITSILNNLMKYQSYYYLKKYLKYKKLYIELKK